MTEPSKKLGCVFNIEVVAFKDSVTIKIPRREIVVSRGELGMEIDINIKVDDFGEKIEMVTLNGGEI